MKEKVSLEILESAFYKNHFNKPSPDWMFCQKRQQQIFAKKNVSFRTIF